MSSSIPAFVWTPSGERIVPVYGQATGSPSNRQASVLPLRWPDAPAGSSWDYGLDCTVLLAGGDTIETVTVGAGALQLLAQVVQGGVVTVWLTGLVAGVDYPVGIAVATQAGRTLYRVVRVKGV